MTPMELQDWLTEHIDRIVAFVDYEPTIESEEELAETFGYWFGSGRWAEAGHRFVHLGIDGTGGQFAVWLRKGAQAPHPVVLFGSEGGRGVLATTPARWAQILAHAPTIDDYEEPASLSAEGNWMLDPGESDPDEVEEARGLLAEYRAAVEARFGPLPALDELTAGLAELNAEFIAWIEASVDHG